MLWSGSLRLPWNRIDSADLVGYKVVASIQDSTPVYSENGYYKWITDADTTSCTIYNGDSYTSGDFGQFTGGQAYYFSVTAIYGSEWQKIAGNTVQAVMPGAAAAPDPEGTYPAVTLNDPALSGTTAALSWSRTTDTTGFNFYKVVVSTTDDTPVYPENGYVYYTTNPDELTYSYVPGGSGTYYISITAVYTANGTTHYIPSNVKTVVIP